MGNHLTHLIPGWHKSEWTCLWAENHHHYHHAFICKEFGASIHLCFQLFRFIYMCMKGFIRKALYFFAVCLLHTRPHTLHGSSNSRSLPSTVTVMPGDVNSPYLKQFVHSKSQQYRRLKTEWRNNVYLRRSNIQVSSGGDLLHQQKQHFFIWFVFDYCLFRFGCVLKSLTAGCMRSYLIRFSTC